MGSAVSTQDTGTTEGYFINNEGRLVPIPKSRIHISSDLSSSTHIDPRIHNLNDAINKDSNDEKDIASTFLIGKDILDAQEIVKKVASFCETLNPNGFAANMLIYASNNFQLSPHELDFLLEAVSLIIDESKNITTCHKDIKWSDSNKNHVIMCLIISLLVCIPENELYVSFKYEESLLTMWNDILGKMEEIDVKIGPKVKQEESLILYVDNNPSTIPGHKNPHSTLYLNRKWMDNGQHFIDRQTYNLFIFGDKMYCWRGPKHQDWDILEEFEDKEYKDPDSTIYSVVIQFILPWRTEMS